MAASTDGRASQHTVVNLCVVSGCVGWETTSLSLNDCPYFQTNHVGMFTSLLSSVKVPKVFVCLFRSTSKPLQLSRVSPEMVERITSSFQLTEDRFVLAFCG